MLIFLQKSAREIVIFVSVHIDQSAFTCSFQNSFVISQTTIWLAT